MEIKNETKYYKVLNAQMNHYGFQYKLGLNIDTKEFKPEGSCREGGLYYTTEEHLEDFLEYGIYVADIEIPSDAKVYKDPSGNKLKADRLIITKITPFADSDIIKKIVFKKIYKDPMHLCLIEQTLEICLEAVKQNGFALRFVKEQTEQLCLEAVKQNGLALQYVKEQTYLLCLEAVKRNGCALEYVKEQTTELCLEAVKQDVYALQIVKEQTEQLCLEAVKQNRGALQFVKKQIEQLCLEAIKQDKYAYHYIKPESRTWKLFFKSF